MASTAKSTRTGGRTPISFTDEHRMTVHQMTAYGISQNDICKVLNITVPTLHKHFRREIDTAFPIVHAKIVNSLVQNAIQNQNVTAQIFWLKTRGGWIEARPDRDDQPNELTIKIEGGLRG